MNRERAETSLRLLAEAALRSPLRTDPGAPWWVQREGRTRVMAVAQALAAVGALDAGTAEDILNDYDLAEGVRKPHLEPGPGRYAAAARPFTAGRWPVGWPARLRLTGPMPMLGLPRPPGAPEPAGFPEPAGPEPPGDGAERDSADCFVPVGLTVPFHGQEASGELCLMSFARTGSGARLFAVWTHTEAPQLQAGLLHPDLIPFELITVTDDQGTRYDLGFVPGGGPGWAGEISLRPTPPPGIRWLDVAAPLSPAVRVELSRTRTPADAGPEAGRADLSPGEHLLIRLAEQLLAVADSPHRPGRPLPAASLGHHAWAAGLGDIIAALEAAEVLPPLSGVPARLAALCASLDIDGHRIAVPPAHELPETWLSLLAHYQRRKPDAAPVRDGYAAVAAALPEVDGIRLALLGLHNSDGRSALHMLARGLAPGDQHGRFGAGADFPLSVWVRDSGGRWHAARPVGWRGARREYALMLGLTPPLPRSAAWIEVLASGRSAEACARLPLRWRGRS